MNSKKYLYVIILLLISINNYAQNFDIRFKRISIEDGLSQSTVTSITQDDLGFIWFGTYEGLNRYDGYKFVVYKNDIQDSSSISGNWITSIFIDAQQQFWVGTDGDGLNLFNRKQEKFIAFPNLEFKSVNAIEQINENELLLGTEKGAYIFDKKYHKTTKITKLSNINILSLKKVFKEKYIYIGTQENGLYVYKIATKKVEQCKNVDKERTIYSLEQKDNYVFAGTEYGLYLFQSDTDNAIIYINKPNDKNSISGNYIRTLHIDKNENIWIGTNDNGISLLKKEFLDNGEVYFYNYKHNPFIANTISKNQILSVYEDRSGVIWIGTKGGGINKIEPSPFRHFKKSIIDLKESYHNSLWSIFIDSEENLWLGYEYEIMRFNKGDYFGNEFEIYSTDNNKLKRNGVRAMQEDKNGNIWMGTKNGLQILDYKSNKSDLYIHNDNNNSLINNNIRALYIDSKNRIWVGTAQGLSVMIKQKNKFQFLNFTVDKKEGTTISHNRINAFAEDKAGVIWIGTSGGGLNRVYVKNDGNEINDYQFEYFRYNAEDEFSTNDKYIISLLIDNENNVWAGGYDGGINYWNRKTKRFTYITEKDSLINNVIYGITQDKDGYIWVSTNKGISRYNPVNKKVKSYDKQDGLQSNEFNRGAYYKAENGDLYFGGINGLNVFSPDEINNNMIAPLVAITDFKIFNNSVNPDKSDYINKSILFENQINMSYKDRIFSFEFVGLSYVSQHKNQYAYKLEGFDDEWNYVKSDHRNATYTNLRGGDYTFRLKASNNDGLWSNQERVIKIHIAPPFWETWWFRILVTVIIAASLVFWYQQRVKNLKKRQEELERQVDERTAEIALQKEEIESQRDYIIEKNKELEKLSIVASNTDNAVIILDKNGDFEWFNDAFVRIYGYSFTEFKKKVGTNIKKTTNYEKIIEIFDKCVNQKQSVIYENYTNAAKGEQIWTQTTLSPIFNENNEVIKVVAIDSDISKLKEAENEIRQQSEELQVANEELEKQKELLTLQNDQITSSINYARTIQTAMLPLQEVTDKFFNSFIIFRPKDIVSGDFYWYSKQDDLMFVAVIDCTGHGVPGAFMSMIGNRLLNEIVNERQIKSPAMILDLLDDGIKTALKQEQTENSDGMDVCLCSIKKQDINQIKINYCGAKRPLIYYKYKEKKIETIKGTGKHIGGVFNSRSEREFKNIDITLQKNDIIYLTTDGFIDQNDKNRKRFGTSRFIHLLSNNAAQDLETQKFVLETELDKHMINTKQRDDITIWGVRL